MRFSTFCYVFIAFIYITGRICLAATYSFDQESKRCINIVNLPQFVYSTAKTAIQNEKLTPAVIRRIDFKDTSLFFENDKRFFLSGERFISLNAFTGNYIDPPPIL